MKPTRHPSFGTRHPTRGAVPLTEGPAAMTSRPRLCTQSIRTRRTTFGLQLRSRNGWLNQTDGGRPDRVWVVRFLVRAVSALRLSAFTVSINPGGALPCAGPGRERRRRRVMGEYVHVRPRGPGWTVTASS